MTERYMYEVALIEMNKVEAPSLLLEDYNYFMNKAVQQYINKVYNRYDINQQSSDDLRVLKATAEVRLDKEVLRRLSDNTSKKDEDGGQVKRRVGQKEKFVYSGKLPNDYMHILNCIVDYNVKQDYKCYREGDYVEFAAKRLTADMASGITNNVYMKPDYRRPYFYINNVNTSIKSSHEGTNTTIVLVDGNVIKGTKTWDSTNPNMDSSIFASDTQNTKSFDGDRVANASEVRIEIRFGDDDRIFTPEYAYIDYIKAPMNIELTYDDITSTEDNTRVMEFPDYVCFEIINEFVKLLMENASDPRLQTHFAINQSVGDPTVSQNSSKDRS